MHDMGTLGGVRSIAMGINDSGNIIGASTPYNSDYDHAFFYDGEMHDLGSLNGQISVALGINNNNKVVGEYYDINLQIMRAFYYDVSFMMDIGTLGGDQAYASDINNADHIVGTSFLSGNTVEHAFYYDGTMHDIGTMYGGESVATAINDSDVITGFELAKNGYYSFYFDGTMHDIGSFGSDNYTVARAINNKGKIVGVSEYASGIEHAFLYDGTMLDLNNLIPLGAGWEILEAWGINDRDQIAAYGWKDGEGHALLLSPTDMKPIPEPSTIFLLGAGLAGVGLLRRRLRS